MIKVVTTIVDYNMRDEIKKLYKSLGVNSLALVQGKGTATSETLEILGLEEHPKALMFSIIEGSKVDQLIESLSKQFGITKHGKGVSFIIGLSGISKNSYMNLLGNDTEIDEKEKNSMEVENSYELIVTIVEEDYLDDVKDAAIAAGARGGTSVKGLGLGAEEASKFLGITISPEKEIVLNVVKKEEKKKVMEAITKKIGIQQEGKGICFSLPVEEAIGLTE